MKIHSKAYSMSGRLLYVLLYPFFILVPSTRTRGLLFDQDNRILLVKNWIGNDSWDMPGGGAHRGESLPECLSREIYEETGIEINKDSWSFVAEHTVHSTGFVYFSTVIQSEASIRKQWEIIDAAWFSQDALPLKRALFVDETLFASNEATRKI